MEHFGIKLWARKIQNHKNGHHIESMGLIILWQMIGIMNAINIGVYVMKEEKSHLHKEKQISCLNMEEIITKEQLEQEILKV